MLRTTGKLATVSAIALVASLSTADAQAIRSGFDGNTLAANDDGSTGLVDIGFSINFFDVNATQLYVNNNGNITLDNSLSTFTPFDLTSTGRQIIAPFFADVDTRNAGDAVTFGQGTVDGQDAFGVNWVNVDYFSSNIAHTNRNSFQLILIDQGGGSFAIEFNFDQIEWETGGASGGDANGLGGNSARVGFSNGTGDPGTFFELDGSAINGAFLDSGPAGTALIMNSLNSEVLGRYIFFSEDGQIIIVGGGGNDAGIMATETGIVATKAQTENLRQIIRANSGARQVAATAEGARVMSMNGPSTQDFSVWARIGGGLLNADFGGELDLSHFIGQAGVEYAMDESIVLGMSVGGVLTNADTADESLDGDGLFVQPYAAYTDGPLTAIASFTYTRTDYDDSTDVIDDGDRFAGSLSVGYDVPLDDETMATPFGYLAGGVENLDTSSGSESIDFVIGRAGVELSHNVELLNTGTMHVFGSFAAEYISGNEPELAAPALLTEFDDNRFGGRVETGFDFTIAGTDSQLFASVNGSGLFTDAPGFGGRVGLKIPF
jgi:hypothetical protein